MTDSAKLLGSLDPDLSPWHGLAVKWLDFPLGKFLDYGCGRCGLLRLVGESADECHGVDINDEAYKQTQADYPAFQLSDIAQDGKTHYPDAYFDTIAILEVIEHVPNEKVTLAEIARVLKPGGKVLLTTPHRGLLTFMDIANFKFIFPKLHRFVHLGLIRDKNYFDDRFEKTKDKKMVGDISFSEDRPPWHRHYKIHEIESYCPESLELERSIVFFPGMRLMGFLRQLLRVLCLGKASPWPWPLTWLERRLQRIESRTGDQMALILVKKSAAPEAASETE